MNFQVIRDFVVKWTGPADREVAQLAPHERAEAEERVRAHAQTEKALENATQGRIRLVSWLYPHRPLQSTDMSVF